MTPAARFRNALQIMMSLDRHHLVDAGIIPADNEGAWKAFRDFPHEASLHLNNDAFDQLFALIERRQPKHASAGHEVDGPQAVLDAVRDLVVAAEEAGWDIGENCGVLNRARDAFADLQIVMADADDDEVAS